MLLLHKSCNVNEEAKVAHTSLDVQVHIIVGNPGHSLYMYAAL